MGPGAGRPRSRIPNEVSKDAEWLDVSTPRSAAVRLERPLSPPDALRLAFLALRSKRGPWPTRFDEPKPDRFQQVFIS